MINELHNYINIQNNINKYLKELYGGQACLDGIYDTKEYFKRKNNRIVIVLKEVNHKGKGVWSPVDKPCNCYSMYPTPKNRVARVIVNNLGRFLANDASTDKAIRGIGYINLSKKNHYGTKSNDTLLKKTFEETKDSILYPQLHALNPNYIIFGGTFSFFWASLKKEYKSNFYRLKFIPTDKDEDKDFTQELNSFPDKLLSFWKMQKEGPILIQTYHPSASTHKFSYLEKALTKCQNNEYILRAY